MNFPSSFLHPRSLTASLPLKNGGWKTILSYWVSVTFQGRIVVKLRGGGGKLFSICQEEKGSRRLSCSKVLVAAQA